jgi:RTX calcium-binding nonapeptide repeat (4 copies)
MTASPSALTVTTHALLQGLTLTSQAGGPFISTNPIGDVLSSPIALSPSETAVKSQPVLSAILAVHPSTAISANKSVTSSAVALPVPAGSSVIAPIVPRPTAAGTTNTSQSAQSPRLPLQPSAPTNPVPSKPPSPVAPPAPPAPTGSIVYGPTIPQPTAAGDIVGLVLQNNQSTVLASREITFGQVFAEGQVLPGSQLVALVNGTKVPVQMDVKTTNPDGSVAMAVLTMKQPALAANSSVNVMLQSGAYLAAPNVKLSSLTTGGYNFVVDLTLHNADGTTTPFTINVAQALAAALKAGTVSYWLQGPQATEARIDVPISGSLHIAFDITAYADGTTSTEVEFDNDLAMTASGGTANYDVTIKQNGAVAFSQSDITQYQYQTWDQQIWSNGTPQVNVQQDVLALEKTGAIQAYDLTTGVAASVINNEARLMTGPGFGVLGNANILEYMPETGSRADIGTTTLGNAAWLITQNQTAEQYALAQANAAGSVPWHFFDPTTGSYINVANYPKLSTDPSAVRLGFTALTQLMPTPAQSGWTPDPAHQPDLDYDAYLMTGNRYYLDQLNAQAAYDIIATGPNGRQDGKGLVADGADQVRAQAWSLREIVEAAYANPVGSAEKTYFTNIMNANFTFLLSETTTANQGQATGWIPGNVNGTGQIEPWQQDYFASTVVLAAEQGVVAAKELLLWETNFLAGRFLSAAEGFDPHLGLGYRLNTYTPGASESNAYQTWAEIETATLASGDATNVSANGSSWTTADGNYSALARATLAGDITVTGSPEAIQAYGWITAYGLAGTSYQRADPQSDIAARLPDGQYLTSNNIIVSDDKIAANLHGTNADQMIYETGSGNVTITGGTGINILFAGSGTDKLVGGPNNDYLFGGSGSDIMSAGAGTNYMQPGTGAATVLLAAMDSAHDLIADFKVGIDHLAVTDLAGKAATAAEINAMIAGTTNASGSAVLHLSGVHDVTLQGISVGQVTTTLFS